MAPGTSVPGPTNDHLRELSRVSLVDYSSALQENIEHGSHSPKRLEALARVIDKLNSELMSRGIEL